MTCHHGNKVENKSFDPKNIPLSFFGLMVRQMDKGDVHKMGKMEMTDGSGVELKMRGSW